LNAIDLGKIPAACFYLGVLCVVGTFASYSRYGGIPRKTVEGSVHVIHVARGRSFREYICADTCRATGGYTLSLDSSATRAIDRYPANTRFRFIYPDKPKGGALNGVSLVVESIEEFDSGRLIYQQDLLNHPLRIAFYLPDVALNFFTLFLVFWLVSSARRSLSGSEDDPSEPD